MDPNNTTLLNILKEVKLLRNDINLTRTRNSLNVSRVQTPVPVPKPSIAPGPIRNKTHRSRSNNSNTPTTKIGPARKLLNKINNKPTKLGFCWYHKAHGIATNIANCPGPEFCSFDLQLEIAKIKSVIAKLSKTSTPAQNRLPLKTSQPNAPETTVSAPPKKTPTSTIRSPNAPSPAEINAPSPAEIDWSKEIDMELDALPPTPDAQIETLEDQLGDLSD